jgi:iron complex transport system substrate-binding protein
MWEGFDCLVACTKYCAEVCPEVRGSKWRLSPTQWTAQSRQISVARPDLVIVAVPYQEKAVAEIRRQRARFLGLAPSRWQSIVWQVISRHAAGIMGTREEGVRDRRWERPVSEPEENAAPLRARQSFCEEWGKPLIASQLWVAELVEAAGGEFVGNPARKRMWRQWSLRLRT